MIIDSSDDSRFILKNYLLSNNQEVVFETNNGIEAIQKYFLIKPEIIFLDLSMNNYDGLAILKKIRLKDPTSKIVMLTTNDKMNMLEECIHFGAIAFISKPYSLYDISSVISFVNEIEPIELSH